MFGGRLARSRAKRMPCRSAAPISRPEAADFSGACIFRRDIHRGELAWLRLGAALQVGDPIRGGAENLARPRARGNDLHARHIVQGKVHRRIVRAGLQYRLCARLQRLAVGLAAEARLRPEAGQQHALGGGARRVRQQQRVAQFAAKSPPAIRRPMIPPICASMRRAAAPRSPFS